MGNENAPGSRARKFGRNFGLLSTTSKDHLPEPPRRTLSKSPAAAAAAAAKESAGNGSSKQKPTAAIEKRQSKMNLFDLFSKPKVERARGYHEYELETVQERPTELVRAAEDWNTARTPRVPVDAQPNLQRAGSQTLLQVSDNWEPPPLFQAYPQAIKFATLQTINMSAEMLARLQPSRNNNKQDNNENTMPFLNANESLEALPNLARSASKRFSTVANSLGIVEKIFVLVTEGRIVQYPERGNSERMPEKVLQLGKQSAAFACDLIPGKHWVIHVVQAVDEDGTSAAKQSRQWLAKLRLSSARRNTTSFLMVLDSAEEMDAWLKAIRKMIELLGGKRSHSDDLSEKAGLGGKSHRGNQDESPRFLVQKDHNGVSGLKARASPPRPIRPALAISTGAAGQYPSPRANYPRSPRPISLASPSEQDASLTRPERLTFVSETSSCATPNASSDQLRLEQLREGSRYSFISSGTSRNSDADTLPTSMSSSPPSPHKDAFTEPETKRSSPAIPRLSSSQPTALSGKRRSMQPQSTLTEACPATSTRSAPSNTKLGSIFDDVELPAPLKPRRNGAAHSVATPAANCLALRTAETVRVQEEQAAASLRMRSPEKRNPEKHVTPIIEEDDTTAMPPVHKPTVDEGLKSPGASSERQSKNVQSRPRSKLFLRPLPVRPSEPAASNDRETRSKIAEPHIPRRLSSLPNPPTLKLPINASPKQRYSRSPSSNYSPSGSPASSKGSSSIVLSPTTSPAPLTLRRPNSMMIRSDPAPFLSATRTMSVSRSSSAAPPASRAAAPKRETTALQFGPEIPAQSNPGLHSSTSANRPSMKMRASMPVIQLQSLPPPAPPPNIPLPAPPSAQAAF